MSRKKWFSLIVAIGWSLLVYAGPEDAFVQAKAAYDSGDYTKAVSLYEGLRSNGVDNVEVAYNLGNAYFKSGDLPHAVLNYRRAWYQAPRDPDIAANLQFAFEATGVAPPAESRWTRLLHSLSEREWIIVGLTAYVVMLLFLALVLLRPALRFVWWRAALPSALLFLVSAAGWWSWQSLKKSPEWVVLKSDAIARYSPLPDATVRFKLPPGALVRQMRKQPGWVKVRYNRQSGWLKTSDIAPISP